MPDTKPIYFSLAMGFRKLQAIENSLQIFFATF